MTKTASKKATKIAQTQTDDPVAEAQAEVTRLRDLERDFARQRQAKAIELADVEAHSGDQVVAAAMRGDQEAVTRGLGVRVAELRAEVDTLDKAGSSTRRRRREAIPAVREARAQAAERAAVELETQADVHQRTNDRLLAQLEEHAGCKYSPTPPNVSPVAQEGFRIVVVGAPRFTILRNEAGALRQTAAALRRQPTIDHGTVSAVGVDALIEGILADEMRIGPEIGRVAGWAREVDDKERERRRLRGLGGQEGPGYFDPAAALGFRMTWRAGEIVPSESSTYAPEADAGTSIEKILQTPVEA